MERFFLAYKDDKLISAVRIVCFNGIAYANFVVSSDSESTNLGGSYLTWYTIEWAKNNDYQYFVDESKVRKVKIKTYASNFDINRKESWTH